LPSFSGAVAAGAAAVMAAYNRVNGQYMSEHSRLLDGVLRDEWGFEGPVVSDWWGTHDAVAAAKGGLDLEMPGVSPMAQRATRSRFLPLAMRVDLSGRLGVEPPLYWRPIDRWVAADGQPDPYPPSYFGDDLRDAVESGTVPEGTVDRMVHHVLTLYDQLGLLGGNRKDAGSVDAQAHHDLAREVATRGTVILENDGLLPLSGDESLAVIGANADRAKTGGGGSSAVTATRTVSPVDGLRDCAPSVRFERGVSPVAEPSTFEVPGRHWLRRRLSRGARDAAVSAAAEADVAVVVVQDDATESEDRESLRLPGGQDRLVRAVATANPQTVVVCRTSGPVRMPWVDEVGAVLATWYPGQADGEALADVCYGTDPGGRLPVTFGHEFGDYPVAEDRRYPGVGQRVHYDEDVFVGYRGFDHGTVDPLFAFGHGCSYTTFAYEDLSVTRAGEASRADLTVENTGKRHGRDVVQVYVSPPDGPVDRPPKELAAFRPVSLAPGEREQVSLTLPRRSLARYDVGNGWTVDAGTYEIVVGRSSTDQRLRTTMTID
jgi:beta-glucosidase